MQCISLYFEGKVVGTRNKWHDSRPRVIPTDQSRSVVMPIDNFTIADLPQDKIRITCIRSGFWRFLSDTAVLHFDTDFNKIYVDIIFNHIMSSYASQNYSTME